jgi:hypothetical protein
LNAAVAGKVLFSYFDNEEDENEAAEDPILRQVALNKSNPQPKEYSQSQMYAKSLTFGNFSASSSSIYDNSRNDDKVDIENKGKMIANDVGDDGVPADNDSAFQNNDMCSNTLLLFKVLLEGAIVFTRGLCGCLYIACREATNGVGAPLRQRDDLASRLRRGEVVPAPLDSEIGGSSSIRGGSWIRMLLVMLNALRDPEVSFNNQLMLHIHSIKSENNVNTNLNCNGLLNASNYFSEIFHSIFFSFISVSPRTLLASL